MTAAFLGLGSCYLLAPRRVAHGFAAVMIVLAVYAAVRIAFYTVPPEVAAQIASAPFNDVTNVKTLPVLPGDLPYVAAVMSILDRSGSSVARSGAPGRSGAGIPLAIVSSRWRCWRWARFSPPS